MLMPRCKDLVFYQLLDWRRGPHPGEMTGTTEDLQGDPSLSGPEKNSLDDAERLRDFGQNVRRAQELLPLMGCADDCAQPRFSLRYDWITDGRREDTCCKKVFREFERLPRVSHMARNNPRLAH